MRGPVPRDDEDLILAVSARFVIDDLPLPHTMRAATLLVTTKNNQLIAFNTTFANAKHRSIKTSDLLCIPERVVISMMPRRRPPTQTLSDIPHTRRIEAARLWRHLRDTAI